MAFNMDSPLMVEYRLLDQLENERAMLLLQETADHEYDYHDNISEDTRLSIIGDGNCFFRAVIEAIKHKNLLALEFGRNGHETLRAMVVGQASEGGYAFDWTNDCDKSKDEWVLNMSQNGIWADTLAVRACSDLLQIPIQITSVSEMGCSTTVFGRHFYECHPYTGVDNQIHLHLEMMHYTVQL
jgi:OTU-like cysteine protease